MTFPSKEERDAVDERLLPGAIRDKQLAARRVPGWMRMGIALPFFAIAVYSIATFTGPYRYAAVLEDRILGGYHPQLAGLLTFIVCLLPAVVILQAVARRIPPTPEELSRPPRARVHKRD